MHHTIISKLLKLFIMVTLFLAKYGYSKVLDADVTYLRMKETTYIIIGNTTLRGGENYDGDGNEIS